MGGGCKQLELTETLLLREGKINSLKEKLIPCFHVK